MDRERDRNLFGEGLAVVPCAGKDNAAVVVNGVTYGNHTKHIKRQITVLVVETLAEKKSAEHSRTWHPSWKPDSM